MLEIAKVELVVTGEIARFNAGERALVYAQVAGHCSLPNASRLAERSECQTNLFCNHFRDLSKICNIVKKICINSIRNTRNISKLTAPAGPARKRGPEA